MFQRDVTTSILFSNRNLTSADASRGAPLRSGFCCVRLAPI